MEILRPWALLLLPLALLPLLWRRRRSALRYSSFLVLPADPLSRALELAERGLGALFVAAAVVGAAEPRTPSGTATHWSRGATLAFVLDQSASMFSPWSGSAEAVPKIAVAREAIRSFAERRPGDRMALIGFGKTALVYSAPAADRPRFLATLDLLESDLGDTVIDAALLRALGLLEEERGPGRRAVLLLSDGAGRLRDPEGIAARFRAAGVRLYWLVIQGGRSPEEGMLALLSALGGEGRAFTVGEVNELPDALDEVAALESLPLRVERREPGTALARAGRWTAVGCLLALGVFALGGRTRRTG